MRAVQMMLLVPPTRMIRYWMTGTAAGTTIMRGNSRKLIYENKCFCSVAVETTDGDGENKKNFYNNWLMLPAYSTAVDGSSIGKKLSGQTSNENMTALKWIRKCYPELPRCLVQKLFRLRQIRKKCSQSTEELQPRRVGATDIMKTGDVIFLPNSVSVNSSTNTNTNMNTKRSLFDEDESRFAHDLVLYKDAAIIVVNKPPGLPVQGGLGIKRSLDELAAKYLRYDSEEYPRLVHRLDRDSSGILVMGRQQLSATILHSIFREKTFEASYDALDNETTLQKKYWALVIGSPRRREGLITVPMIKVVVDDGKSERITVTNNLQESSAQHAVTKYRILDSSSPDYTWLELSPLTGRKHQLRVHCAEVLGTPIVGDYKYGRQAHKKIMEHRRRLNTEMANAVKGSICDEEFLLHLHCKEMILPDISHVLRNGDQISNLVAPNIKLDAPLPSHMQKSWEFLSHSRRA